MTRQKRRRHRVPWPLAALGVLLLVCAGGLTGWIIAAQNAQQSLPQDLHGNHVQLDSGSLPSRAQAKAMGVASTGLRFKVPSVGMDVALSSLSSVNGEITPPGFKDAYLVRDKGVSLAQATTGTVYVVMHSIQGGFGPGNYLTNVQKGTVSLPVGSTIQVGDRTYTTTGSALVRKTQLADDQAVWANTPSRLIVITCLERLNGASTHNAIITATLTH